MIAFDPIVDNADAGRFELTFDGQIAFVGYRRDGNRIILTHTEVPLASRGRGVGSRLVRGVLDSARAEGAEVVPLCPFVAWFIQTHPAYLDLVSERSRQRVSFNLERAPRTAKPPERVQDEGEKHGQ